MTIATLRDLYEEEEAVLRSPKKLFKIKKWIPGNRFNALASLILFGLFTCVFQLYDLPFEGVECTCGLNLGRPRHSAVKEVSEDHFNYGCILFVSYLLTITTTICSLVNAALLFNNKYRYALKAICSVTYVMIGSLYISANIYTVVCKETLGVGNQNRMLIHWTLSAVYIAHGCIASYTFYLGYLQHRFGEYLLTLSWRFHSPDDVPTWI